MGERRALVIGSQCESAGDLSFLPEVAEDLYAVLTDPDVGGWVPALPANGLLLNPTAAAAEAAIEMAFEAACKDDAVLLLAMIGHGEHIGRDFYFLLKDSPWPPSSRTAFHLVQRLKEMNAVYSFTDGLVVLLDACHSGRAADGAGVHWIGEPFGPRRFQMLTSVADLTAADGCFSRTLASLLRTGIHSTDIDSIKGRHVGATIWCEHVRPLIADRCPRQQEPQLPANNADAGLFLAKNVAFLRHQPPWWGTSGASEIERLTEWFQPTPQLLQVVETAQSHRCVALLGEAGSGKSALAAALARSDAGEGAVPAAFVQAVVFLSEAVTTELLARDLARQLERAVPDFEAASASFQHSLTWEERQCLDPLERRVLGPLRWLKTGSVRLVIDGLDRLPAAAEMGVYKALSGISTGPQLAWLHLLVTARPDTPIPPGAHRLDLARADDGAVRAYLSRRAVRPALHEPIAERAAGNWLVARLLADLAAADPGVDPDLCSSRHRR